MKQPSAGLEINISTHTHRHSQTHTHIQSMGIIMYDKKREKQDIDTVREGGETVLLHLYKWRSKNIHICVGEMNKVVHCGVS